MLLILFTLTLSRYPTYFFFNDTATTEIYTLSLHDALPIWFAGTPLAYEPRLEHVEGGDVLLLSAGVVAVDRKSTRLNSSHPSISYAVFCLKKKNQNFHLQSHHNSSFSCLLFFYVKPRVPPS